MKLAKSWLAFAAAVLLSGAACAIEPAKYVIPESGVLVGTAKEIYDRAPAQIKSAFDQLNSPEMTAAIKAAMREPVKDEKQPEKK